MDFDASKGGSDALCQNVIIRNGDVSVHDPNGIVTEIITDVLSSILIFGH